MSERWVCLTIKSVIKCDEDADACEVVCSEAGGFEGKFTGPSSLTLPAKRKRTDEEFVLSCRALPSLCPLVVYRTRVEPDGTTTKGLARFRAVGLPSHAAWVCEVDKVRTTLTSLIWKQLQGTVKSKASLFDKGRLTHEARSALEKCGQGFLWDGVSYATHWHDVWKAWVAWGRKRLAAIGENPVKLHDSLTKMQSDLLRHMLGRGDLHINSERLDVESATVLGSNMTREELDAIVEAQKLCAHVEEACGSGDGRARAPTLLTTRPNFDLGVSLALTGTLTAFSSDGRRLEAPEVSRMSRLGVMYVPRRVARVHDAFAKAFSACPEVRIIHCAGAPTADLTGYSVISSVESLTDKELRAALASAHGTRLAVVGDSTSHKHKGSEHYMAAVAAWAASHSKLEVAHEARDEFVFDELRLRVASSPGDAPDLVQWFCAFPTMPTHPRHKTKRDKCSISYQRALVLCEKDRLAVCMEVASDEGLTRHAEVVDGSCYARVHYNFVIREGKLTGAGERRIIRVSDLKRCWTLPASACSSIPDGAFESTGIYAPGGLAACRWTRCRSRLTHCNLLAYASYMKS